MIISMHPAELAVAYTLAVMRNSVARGHNVPDKQMGDQDPVEIDWDGIVGELAMAKAYNLFPDLTVSPRSGGHDLVGRNGKTIDVKTTRHKNGRLLAELGKESKRSDMYVLAVRSGATVLLAGWAPAALLLQDENIRDLGHGRGYALDQTDLRPMPEVRDART